MDEISKFGSSPPSRLSLGVLFSHAALTLGFMVYLTFARWTNAAVSIIHFISKLVLPALLPYATVNP
jgi:hypothetical protein